MAKQISGSAGAGGRASKAAANAKVAPDTPGDDATAATVGGSAVAYGDDTLATGNVSLTVVDRGSVTSVRGEAKASAAATGSGTYAAAETYADVEGADFVLTRTVRSSGSGSDSSTATSTTKVTAFTFDKFDLPGGTLELNFEHERQSGSGVKDGQLDGNAAVVRAEATAVGDDSATLAQTDSFATEGLSTVSGDAYVFLG